MPGCVHKSIVSSSLMIAGLHGYDVASNVMAMGRLSSAFASLHMHHNLLVHLYTYIMSVFHIIEFSFISSYSCALILFKYPSICVLYPAIFHSSIQPFIISHDTSPTCQSLSVLNHAYPLFGLFLIRCLLTLCK